MTWLADGEVSIGAEVFGGLTSTENVTLILAPGCADQVTSRRTWNGYKFKSIQILCADDTLNHTYEYTDNGINTHHMECSVCGYAVDEAHSYDDGLCVCGNAQVTITRQPTSFEGLVGDMATFTVEAEGKGPTYQWQVSTDGENWAPSFLGGYNTNTFSFEVNANRAGKVYKCVITDAAGNTVETDVVSVILV